jgi:hypothetical protein
MGIERESTRKTERERGLRESCGGMRGLQRQIMSKEMIAILRIAFEKE